MSDTKNKFNSEFGYDLQVDTAKISIDFDTNVGNPVNTVLGHNGTQFILVDQNLLDSTNATLTNDLSGDDGTRKGTVKTYVFEKLVDPSIVGCANCDSNTDVYNNFIIGGALPIINREIIAEFEIEPEAYHSLEIDLVGHRRVGVDGSRIRVIGTKNYDNCISGGDAFTIALKAGEVLAWGQNSKGQCLGTKTDGTAITTSATGASVQILGQVLTGVSAIAGGGYHTIALKDGKVLAWGDQTYGQCTAPTTAQSGVSAIAGGGGHTIALKDGAVLAWGDNRFGQCTIPVAAQSGVIAIAGGSIHTIALKNDGTIIAWGYNGDGRCLGTKTDGTAITTSATGAPVQIMGQVLTGVSAIASGYSHGIALKGGAVLAWGDNGYGQCTIPASATIGVSAIAGGQTHTIALKNGEVLAWGRNLEGQCTIPLSAQSGVSAIAGGANHTIALKNEAVLAWGYNNFGQSTILAAATSGIYNITFTTSPYGSYDSYIDSATPKAITIPSDLHISGNATTGFEPYRSLNPDILEANHPFLDYSCCPCCDAIESGDPAAETICNNSSQYFITPATTYYDYCAVTTRKYLDSDKNRIENITQCELLNRTKEKYGFLPNTTLPNCNLYEI